MRLCHLDHYDEFGGVITTSSTRRTVPTFDGAATTGEDYLERLDLVFITVDGRERLLPAALCSMLRVTTLLRTPHLRLALHLQ
ncbi:hypothetical protein J7298_02968 [Nakaseomyces glabratus]|nr:hypothetical protein J7298_02968 [Nakaseomyces glabratus]